MKQASVKAWDRNALKAPHRVPDKPSRVKAMFSALAGRYDLANRLLSMNMDRRWRREAVALARPKAGQTVLDLCCGTGEMTWAFLRAEPELAEIVGLDFSPEMLSQAARKSRQQTVNEQPGGTKCR